MKRYDIARADFEALEKIEESDQVELDASRETLMRNPTKAVAADLYEMGIAGWFKQHGVTERTREIAKRHLIE